MDRCAGQVVAVIDAQRATRLLGERRHTPEADCRKRQSNRKPRPRTHQLLPSPPLAQNVRAEGVVLCSSTLDGGIGLSKPCALTPAGSQDNHDRHDTAMTRRGLGAACAPRAGSGGPHPKPVAMKPGAIIKPGASKIGAAASGARLCGLAERASTL